MTQGKPRVFTYEDIETDEEALARLSKQEGYSYLSDIQAEDNLTFKGVADVDESWSYNATGLTEEAQIAAGIAIGAMTGGAGFVGMKAALISSSATIVSTQGTNSLLRGENVNQAMGGIVNENTIKQVGVSVVTAGLLDKYGDQVTGKITNQFGITDQVAIDVVKQGVNTTISAGVNQAVYGGEIGENFRNAYKTPLSILLPKRVLT